MAKQTDQQKELRHLSRSELIEIIYRQQLLLEDLQQRLSDSKETVGQLGEQIRNFEANRSLSSRTDQLAADIKDMSRQLEQLSNELRQTKPAGASASSAESKPIRPAVPPPPVPMPRRSVPGASVPLPPIPAPKRNAPGTSIPRRANRITPPVSVQPPDVEKASETEAVAPTIAQQLKGMPFR